MPPLPRLIFASRWLQVPLYVGLIVAQIVYVVKFGQELWHLSHVVYDGVVLGDEPATTAQTGERLPGFSSVVMLGVLELIDIVMIANLLQMVVIGGYETFVSRMYLEGHPDEPEWLSHVNAAVLKVKLATAIIGISSIHLLQTFIEQDVAQGDWIRQVAIHLTFLVSAIALAWSDRLLWRPASAPVH